MSVADEPIVGGSAPTASIEQARISLRTAPNRLLTGEEASEIVNAFVHWGGLVGIRWDVAFAQSTHETNRYRFGNQVAIGQRNPAGIGATNDGAAGLTFPTWRAGIAAYFIHLLAWCDRLDLARLIVADPQSLDPRVPLVAQVRATKGKATSWASLGGRWAVPGVGYGEAIARHHSAILATGQESTMGHVPKPPLNVRPVVPPKSSGTGYDLSATPRKPIGTCTHSMVGTLWGTDGHFRLPGTAGLTDFGIGQKDLGEGYAEIIQWCDPFGKVIPWANGEATGIEGGGRRFVDTFGVNQINRGLVSIETEDGGRPLDAQGRPSAPATAAQWSSLVWLTAYIHAEWCGQTAATFDWHLLHKEFATKDCPFPRIYTHLGELRSAIVAVMRHWQEGAAYPANGVVINGLRLTVPTGAAAPAIASPFIRMWRHFLAA